MRSNLVDIKIYFPKILPNQTSKQKLVNLIVEEMRKDKAIQCAGYLKKNDLQKDILRYMGNTKSNHYRPLTNKQKKNIKDAVREAARRCHKKLPHPYPPVFVFMYPWFPNGDDAMLFNGVNAFASYHTIHLFLDNESYKIASIKHTIAHEWNHLIYYKYHQKPFSLKDHLFMEGAAEVFREEIFGGKPAPWSTALKNSEIKKQFASLRSRADTKGFELYRRIFWGSKDYKRWTGYSIGYWLIKNFRKKNRGLTWEKIIKTNPEDVLASIIKNGA